LRVHDATEDKKRSNREKMKGKRKSQSALPATDERKKRVAVIRASRRSDKRAYLPGNKKGLTLTMIEGVKPQQEGERSWKKLGRGRRNT